MKHLQKISISNARRLGKDVEIEFGRGATILLAPNGVGKTTIFESIEFALTGSVQRLEESPLSLIRDKQSGVDVRLDFGNGKCCEVEYRKGGDPVLKGDHSILYNGHSRDSIPFLLRLTHLLEQRGNKWFVGADTKNAGRLLDRLSIGRELNQIFNKKQSVQKAVNKERENAKRKVQQAKNDLIDFINLLDEKGKVVSNISLVPLKEILTKIQANYLLVTKVDDEVAENVSSLLAFAAQTKVALNQKIVESSERITQFIELENSVELYLTNQKTLLEVRK